MAIGYAYEKFLVAVMTLLLCRQTLKDIAEAQKLAREWKPKWAPFLAGKLVRAGAEAILLDRSALPARPAVCL